MVGVRAAGSSTAEAKMADELPLVELLFEVVALELRALDRTQKVMALGES